MMLILQGHKGAVRCLAYSPDGRLLASGGDDRTVRLWNLAGGSEYLCLRGHEDWVSALAFDPNGASMTSGGWDDAVRIWSVDGRRELRADHGAAGGVVWSLAYAPDGSHWAVGMHDGHIGMVPVHPPAMFSFAAHRGPVSTLTFSPKGRLLASAGHDCRVVLWETHRSRPSTSGRLLGRHGDWVRALAFAPDGTTLASAGEDGVILLWSVDEGQLATTLTAHQGRVSALAYTPDGRTLVSAGWDETVRLWYSTGWGQRACFNWQIGRLHGLAIAPDGMTAAAAGDGDVVVWDLDA
jgi:WD40 repeat protein